jgi:hypothetical protein
MALYDRTSGEVVCASRAGMVLDGATDNAPAVQAILDLYGAAGKPLEFVVDGPMVCNTIYLWSRQLLRGTGHAQLIKLPFPNNGLPLLMNKHWTTTGTTPVENYVTVRDLYIDGNRRNGGCGVSGSPTPYLNALNQVVPSVGFYGVNRFLVENVHIFDSPSYGLHLANCSNGTIVQLSKFLAAGDTAHGDAVMQLNGGCTNIHAYSLSGSVNDDPIAFNANDGNDATSPVATFIPGTVLQGPIVDCSVRGARFVPGPGTIGHFGRLLSSNPNSYIKDILISGVIASSLDDSGLKIDNFGLPLGNGWYDNITLENCTMNLIGTSGSQFLKIDNATIGRIKVINCHAVPTVAGANPTGVIWLTSNSSVASLKVDGLNIEDPSGNLASPAITLAGALTQVAEIRGFRWNRGTSATLAVPAISCTGTVNRVHVHGGFFDRLSSVVGVSAGTTTDVNVTGFTHTNAGGGASVSQSGGTLSRLRSSCADTALLVSGTIASNKNDGTQDA